MENVQKKSKDGMPAWNGMFGHVLKYLKNGNKPIERRVIVKEVADSLNLPEDLRDKVYKSENGDNIIENRISFTLSGLKISGLIRTVKRGIFEITSDGIAYFDEYGYKISEEMIKSTQNYIDYEEAKKQSKGDAIEPSSESVDSFEMMESIEEMISTAREKKKEELHQIIINSSPYLFEDIVVDLLSIMGYKGKDGKKFTTQKSNDGGIDGYIHHDPLGTQTVYIQAKRYNRKNKIQRPNIESFYGALKSINANRGVFITTSSFTTTALEAAERLSIVLIDGDKLLDLLVDYNVGIKKDKTFYTYKIDEEYFEEN